MVYEKVLNSYAQVLHEIRVLDIDGGVRTTGRYGGKKCFLFVTKSPRGYAIAIYGIKKEGKNSVPDKRMTTQEFDDEEGVKSLLDEVIGKPVKAYSY